MTDAEIAQNHQLVHIQTVADKLGIDPEKLELYGRYKAKLPLSLIDEDKVKAANLVLVTAISPTPAGEGKTTMTIGLAQAMNILEQETTAVLREPSLGPVFGIKGGATGGGYSQVLPMEDINLHFTGDFSAIEKANNLLAALIDNNIQSKTASIGIDPRTVSWKRVIDMNDRALRDIIVGLGGTANGVPRQTGFDITAASEIMAILCLSNDLQDLKTRLGNIFIGFKYDRTPVYAKDLDAHGAMTALLKDAIKPNLVQTMEGTPAIIHGGPFANIAQGTNTVIATKMGLSLTKNVITEAGFGCDLGAEKFLDIKCVSAGLSPKAVVVVATIRALKYHGGGDLKELKTPNAAAVKLGLVNMEKHLENVIQFGLEPVVAINKFVSDTDEEVQVIIDRCEELGYRVAVSEAWEKGGKGSVDVAKHVIEILNNDNGNFKPMYDWSWSVEDKITAVATKVYGAAEIDYAPQAKKDLRRIKKLGLEELPICIAKTQKSLSDNPKLLGRPKDFTITVREIEIAAGAGFLIPITGKMMRMPGLPSVPAANHMDIDADGTITGLF